MKPEWKIGCRGRERELPLRGGGFQAEDSFFFFFLKTNINRKRYEKIGTTIGMIDVRGFLHHRTDRFTWSELKKKEKKKKNYRY